MSDNFSDFPKNFLLAGLFIIAMIMFGIGIANNYGQPASAILSDKIDLTKFQQTINETNADVIKMGEAFRSDNLFVQAGTIVLFSIWGIGKLVWGSVTSLYFLFSDTATAIFGVPPIVTGVVTALLILSMIFLLWKTIKAGDT